MRFRAKSICYFDSKSTNNSSTLLKYLTLPLAKSFSPWSSIRLRYGVGLYSRAENVILFFSTNSRIYSFIIAEKGIPIFWAVFCSASFSFLSVLNMTVVFIYCSIYSGIYAVNRFLWGTREEGLLYR